MNATTDMEIKISNGRIISSEIMPDGSLKVTIEPKTQETVEARKPIFKLIEASKLSLGDAFMHHKPVTEGEEVLRRALRTVIKNNLKDFYCPICDPTFTKSGEIRYSLEADCPYIGNSFEWWKKKAKEYDLEHLSRLGTKSEYIAFLGVLIKRLAASSYFGLDAAWHVVCDSPQAFPSGFLGFYDIGNTFKILASDENDHDFFLAGGKGIAPAYLKAWDYKQDKAVGAVGWIVLERPLYDASKYCLEDDEIMMNM